LAKKRYSALEGELVFQWVDRWFQLGRLLLDLFRFDETPSPPPPTEIDEINYQGLRFWFIDTNRNSGHCGEISIGHRLGFYVRVET